MARAAQPSAENQSDPFETQVANYKMLKDEIDRLTKEQKKIREYLLETVEKAGYEDDLGNFWIELDEPIGGVATLKRERRVSRSLDEEAAETILKNADLWAQCTKTVVVVDEDAVMQCLFDDDLTEDDIDAIYPQKVTWALVVR